LTSGLFLEIANLFFYAHIIPMKAVLSRSYMLTVGVGKYCTTRVSKRHRGYINVPFFLSTLSSFYAQACTEHLMLDGRHGQVE